MCRPTLTSLVGADKETTLSSSLLTPTTVAGVRRSSASVCMSVCPHDRTKATEYNHQTCLRDSLSWVLVTHLILGHRITKCKNILKAIEWPAWLCTLSSVDASSWTGVHWHNALCCWGAMRFGDEVSHSRRRHLSQCALSADSSANVVVSRQEITWPAGVTCRHVPIPSVITSG